MELPSAIKTKFRILGVLPWPNVKGFPIHYVQMLVMYAVLLDSVVFTFWFIKWEAETFSEFAQTLIGMVVGIFYTMIYSCVIWQRQSFASTVEDVERRINSSKCEFRWDLWVVESNCRDLGQFTNFKRSSSLSSWLTAINSKPIQIGIIRPELRAIYEESNAKLSRWLAISNKMVYRLILPIYVVLTVIPVFYIYFFIDHTENAFMQLFPEQLSTHFVRFRAVTLIVIWWCCCWCCALPFIRSFTIRPQHALQLAHTNRLLSHRIPANVLELPDTGAHHIGVFLFLCNVPECNRLLVRHQLYAEHVEFRPQITELSCQSSGSDRIQAKVQRCHWVSCHVQGVNVTECISCVLFCCEWRLEIIDWFWFRYRFQLCLYAVGFLFRNHCVDPFLLYNDYLCDTFNGE